MAERKKFKDLVHGITPAGLFVFPKVNVPDKKFESKFGAFSTGLNLAGQAAEDFKKQIEETYELEYSAECSAQGKQLKRYDGRPYKQATDRDKAEIPGVTTFSFKRVAGGEYGEKHARAGETWGTTVPIFAARGTDKVTAPVYGGTLGRVSYTIVPWFTAALGFGVRLNLEAVKILDLVTAGERSAAQYGFADEDGYVPEGAGAQQHGGDSDGEAGLGEAQGSSTGVEF